MASIKIATLNINGMTSPTRIAMLHALIGRQEIDIPLLQEVTYHILRDTPHNINIGANRRGTALVARDGINQENITMSQSGRAMATKFGEIWNINVFAPFGKVVSRNASLSSIVNCLIC